MGDSTAETFFLKNREKKEILQHKFNEHLLLIYTCLGCFSNH